MATRCRARDIPVTAPLPRAPSGECVTARYRTIWVSDTHLGTRGCQALALLEFLDGTECEYLYLVGDIIDFWRLKRTPHWTHSTAT